MPALAPDPDLSRPRDPSRPGATDRPVDDDEPVADPATDRLRSLLAPRSRLADLVDRWPAARLIAEAGPTRTVAVVVAAAALGAAAYLAVGMRSSPVVDPVQVLPRVVAASTDGGGGSAPAPVGAPGEGATGATGTAPASVPARIQVHAAGAVANPGVHVLGGDARVADLMAAAGGLSPDADPDRINLAAPVRDGERVFVPRRGELDVPPVVAGDPGGGPPGASSAPGVGGESTASPPGPASRVDVNTADAAGLDTLPGVGPTTAAAIIAHRTEHGPFRSVDDLQEVPGIGPAKLAQIRDLVLVG